MSEQAKLRPLIFKCPPELVEALDAYATRYCESNRSLAIRQAIRLMLEKETRDTLEVSITEST